jgi:hypothetical protein
MGKAAKQGAEGNNANCCRKWESDGPIIAKKCSKERRSEGALALSSKQTQKDTELIDGDV